MHWENDDNGTNNGSILNDAAVSVLNDKHGIVDNISHMHYAIERILEL